MSSVGSGEASSTTTTFIFVAGPPETTSIVSTSSVNSQTFTSVVGTELPTIPESFTSSSAATLSQYTASSQRLVPGSSVQGNAGGYPTANTSSTENVAAIVVGGSTIASDASSQYMVSGQSLLLGSSITLVQGSSTAVLALPTGQPYVASSLVVTAITPIPTATSGTIPIMIGSNFIMPDASSRYIISGQTLTAGSKIILLSESSTAIVALKASNSQTFLIVETSTSMLSEQTASPGLKQQPAFTIGSSVVTPNSASEYVIASQTLRPGAAITVSGSVISLTSHATAIVIGTNTQTAAYQQGLGRYIWSALGALSTVAETSASGATTTSPGSPKTSGLSASDTDSVLSSASGTSSLPSTNIITPSISGATQQGSTITGGTGSSGTSASSSPGTQATSTSGSAQSRSVGIGLAVLLLFVTLIVEHL